MSEPPQNWKKTILFLSPEALDAIEKLAVRNGASLHEAASLLIERGRERNQQALEGAVRKILPPRAYSRRDVADRVEAIKVALTQGLSQREIARQFGTHQSIVSDIATGKYGQPRTARKRRGEEGNKNE